MPELDQQEVPIIDSVKSVFEALTHRSREGERLWPFSGTRRCRPHPKNYISTWSSLRRTIPLNPYLFETNSIMSAMVDDVCRGG